MVEVLKKQEKYQLDWVFVLHYWSIDAIHTAAGSCQVNIGNTCVITGIKLEIGVPSDVTPECGLMGIKI